MMKYTYQCFVCENKYEHDEKGSYFCNHCQTPLEYIGMIISKPLPERAPMDEHVQTAKHRILSALQALETGDMLLVAKWLQYAQIAVLESAASQMAVDADDVFGK